MRGAQGTVHIKVRTITQLNLDTNYLIVEKGLKPNESM
uniref:Uncharacterized protein n=1 Tax=Medicago truncatula TaxID=3880 RepID=A2Q3D7_MEDTR|nr:hypothetical protein MtrDRAFT_AC155881g7v1 [Medicago truncatula]